MTGFLCHFLISSLVSFVIAADGKEAGNWSSCTKTCGFGTQSSLQCKLFKTGECLITHRGCNRQSCPDDVAWGICSVTCGRGFQIGFKPNGLNLRRICHQRPCHKALLWSNCSKSCGNGTQYKFTDADCTDEDDIYCKRTFRLCNLEDCPIKFCSKGTHRKYRRRDECCKIPTIVKTRKNNKFKRTRNSGKWPWMVVISSRSGICDGSLIDTYWVLTAAHCVIKRKTVSDKIFVHVGVLDWRNPGFYDRHLVTRVIAYPKYRNYHEDDIAILRLGRPVKNSMNMKMIGLPYGQDTLPGTICFNTGWHNTTTTTTTIKKKRENMSENPVQIFDLNACRTAYNIPPHNKTLCYGSTLASKDECRGGYSGSAVVCHRCSSCQWYIAGVHSFSSSVQNCPDIHKPRGAVKVVNYEKWILRYIPALRMGQYKTPRCPSNPIN